MAISEQLISNSMQAALQKVADVYVKRVRERLDAGRYPDGDQERGLVPIQQSIVIGEPKSVDGGTSITVTIGGESAPYAAAYEYGSGIHRTKKQPNTYRIVPVNAGAMAFPFEFTDYVSGKMIGIFIGRKFYPNEKVNQMIRESEHGSVISEKSLWMHVDHPGVEPKPFAVPALQDVKDTIKKMLMQAFKVSIAVTSSDNIYSTSMSDETVS